MRKKRQAAWIPVFPQKQPSRLRIGALGNERKTAQKEGLNTHVLTYLPRYLPLLGFLSGGPQLVALAIKPRSVAFEMVGKERANTAQLRH